MFQGKHSYEEYIKSWQIEAWRFYLQWKPENRWIPEGRGMHRAAP